MRQRPALRGVEVGIKGELHAVKKRETTKGTLEFGDWEIDNDIWEREAEREEVQELLIQRQAKEIEEALGDILLTQEDILEEVQWTQEKKEGVLLLIDAANGVNMLSCLGMLWTVRHRCPRLARFTFNCYRH
jgi:hypothetical protein